MADLMAYGDESAVTARDGRQVYVLAASVISGDANSVRARLREMLPTHQRARTDVKLHWYDEGNARRSRLATAAADLAATTHLAVCTDVMTGKDERAHAICLERLLALLEEYGVSELLLERRDTAGDRRDIRLAQNLRRANIGVGLRVNHGNPFQEELLWLPDIMAGAFTTARTGDGAYWQSLAASAVIGVHPVPYR